MDFPKFTKTNFARDKFLKIRSFINLPWGHDSLEASQIKFGPNGSAVLIFIGYKPGQITDAVRPTI